jgi:hypothetical protein
VGGETRVLIEDPRRPCGKPITEPDTDAQHITEPDTDVDA